MDIPAAVRQLVPAPEVGQADTKAPEPVQNRFDMLNPIFRVLLAMISPRSVGLKINASVEVGKHGAEKGSYKIRPGVTLSDGKPVSTGFFQVILVLVQNTDANIANITKCLAASVKKIVRGENGGKIGEDLMKRAEKIVQRFIANDPRWPVFLTELSQFLQAPEKPKKGRALVKVVLRGEHLPENEFYLPTTEPAFNAFRAFAIEMKGNLNLVDGDVDLNPLSYSEFKVQIGMDNSETVEIGFAEPTEEPDLNDEPLAATA